MKLSHLIKNNKGQSWYLDFILAITVMIIVGVIFVKLIISFSGNQQDVQEFTDEARNIANTLLSSGNPKSANDQNYNYDYQYFRLGLTNDDYKIDKAKFDILRSFSDSNYEKLKTIIGTNLDFYVVLEDRDGNFRYNFGHPTVKGVTNEEDINIRLATLRSEFGGVKNSVGLVRIVYYDDNPSDNNLGEFFRMVVRVW